MKLFAYLNAVFLALFIVLALAHPAWWVWVIFAVVWFVADWWVVSYTGFHMSWKGWVGLLVLLTVVDLGVLYFTGAFGAS